MYKIPLIILIIGFLLGYTINELLVKRKRRNKASELYSLGYRKYKEKEYYEALALLNEANGASPHYETFNILGHIYDELKEYCKAASSFDDARRLAWKSNLQYIAYAYYRSSFSHSKNGNWEFSYERANSGLGLIEVGEIPRYMDDIDMEEKLRAIRMVAALHHLQCTESMDLADKDASWILENSKNEIELGIAKGVVGLKFCSKDILNNITNDFFNLE